MATIASEYAGIEDESMSVRSLLTIPAILLATLSFALSTPVTAHGRVDTVVSISGTLTGPTGVAKLGVTVRGTAAHLTGSGGSAQVAPASPATFAFDGALDGVVVTLQGDVAHAGFEFLVGTPVALTANASTGEIDLVVGPFPGGPQAGEVRTFRGIGDVSIVDHPQRSTRPTPS